MKLGLLALIAICSVSASLPASAMPIAPLASNAQAVELVKPEPIYRARLAVREHDGLSNQLGLRLVELCKDRAGSELCGRHGYSSEMGAGAQTRCDTYRTSRKILSGARR